MPEPSDDAAAAPTLGAALRAAREQAGRTVEQVSADTRIRATLVRDLEADHLASSGGTVYARGHVKSIASALRTDPAPLLALFDRAQGPVDTGVVELAPEPPAGSVTSLGGTSFAANAAASLRPERSGPRWGLALAGAAAALVAITAVGYLQQSDSPAGDADVLAGGDPSPTAQPTTPARATTPPGPDSVASKPPVTGAQLRLRIIGGSSWVSVSNAAGTTLFEGILADGQFKDFTDGRRLKVVLGNSYVVSLNCGGKDSGVPGSGKVVRRYACTSTGLADL